MELLTPCTPDLILFEGSNFLQIVSLSLGLRSLFFYDQTSYHASPLIFDSNNDSYFGDKIIHWDPETMKLV